MSRIEELTIGLSPTAVVFRPLSTLGRRNSGTAMTAAKMKTIRSVGGPVRVFAGGRTIADVDEESVPAKDIVREPSIIVKSRGHIGFTFYERPFTHKAELWSYSLTDPAVDQKFVYYYLLTKVDELRSVARASSVKLPQLGVRDTDTLRVPVPPLEVQREIVRILDNFTELEAGLEAELEAELEARRNQYAYLRDSLLGGVATDSTWRPMGELGEFTRGRRFTRADVVDGGISSIHYGEIYTHYSVAATTPVRQVREDLRPQLRFALPGDVVIASVGETVEDVGKAVAWLGDEPVAIHDDTFGFRSSMNPKFVSYWMQTEAFHSQKTPHVASAKIKRLSSSALASIIMPVPAMDEQERIVKILDKFDALVNDLSTGLPAELAARRKQYEYYRDRLLTFEEAPA